MRSLYMVAFATTVAVTGGTGSAADLRPKPAIPTPYVSPWAGSYGGVFAGGHWSRDRWGSDSALPEGELGPFDLTVNGFTGGALLGANIQQGSWVWGAELDAGFLTGSKTFPASALFPNDTSIDSIEAKIRWNAHARLRFGYDMGSWMPFVAGGVAYANTRITIVNSANEGPTTQSVGLDRVGFTMGGGLDWMFMPNWIARVEYLYDRYTAASFVSVVNSHSRHMELDSQALRGALIYKFGGTAAMASAGPLPAFKAPAAAPGAPTWAGAYVGLFAGGHWSRDRWSSDETAPVSRDGPIDLNVKGFTGGALIGGNVQYGSLVWGTEADAGVLTRSATFVAPPPPSGELDTLETKPRWNAHARLRFGYDMGSWMPFVAAGVAYANSRVDIANPDSPVRAKSQSIGLNRVGYTLGAGIDWMPLPNWIARVEYLHDRYTNAAFGAVSEIDSEFMGLRSNIVRGAIIHKFSDAPMLASSGPAPVFKAPPATRYASIWSGVYAGLFAGGHWSRDRYTSDAGPIGEFGPFNLNVNGFSGGGLVGANFHQGNVVWGTEADIGFLIGSTTLSGLPTPTFGDLEVASIETKMRWNAHARLRFGYDMGSWMPFVAAGVAYADTNVSLATTPALADITGRPLRDSADVARIGYTVGGGVDWMLASNWIARVEYLYDSYATGSFAVRITDDSHHLELQSHIVRGAFIYKFGAQPVAARY